MNQSDRHSDFGLQFFTEKVTDSRKQRRRLRITGSPFARLQIELLLRLHIFRNIQQTDIRQSGGSNLLPGIYNIIQTELHIRLSATNPNISDQYIG